MPFVYTNLDPGYIPSKYNDRGCLKLVYHPAEGEEIPTFINVAYIYVEEDERPGYEHDKEPYNDPGLTQYIFTLSGSGLGKEVNYTVAQLEAMTDLHLEKEHASPTANTTGTSILTRASRCGTCCCMRAWIRISMRIRRSISRPPTTTTYPP